MLENIQAEALIAKFKEEMILWEQRMNTVSAEKTDVYKIKILAQDVCTHPLTEEQDATNYHTNEQWTQVICKVCDKYLKKY